MNTKLGIIIVISGIVLIFGGTWFFFKPVFWVVAEVDQNHIPTDKIIESIQVNATITYIDGSKAIIPINYAHKLTPFDYIKYSLGGLQP